MAKKTEKELRNILKSPKYFVGVDLGEEGKDMSTLVVHEIPLSVKSEDIPSSPISTNYFVAGFDDNSLPQDDEIASISFIPSEDKSYWFVRITFIPKRKTYFKELLTGKPIIIDEPFTIKFFNENKVEVGEETLILSRKQNPFVTQFTLNRDNPLFNDYSLAYVIDFDFYF